MGEDLGRLEEIYEDIESLGENYRPGHKDIEQRAHGFEKGDTWSHSLSASELSKISLVRGLILNPEVLIMHRPTTGFDKVGRHGLMQQFVEHVRNRGIFMPRAGVSSRRPRTVFYSSATEEEFEYADVIWELFRESPSEPSK